MPKRGFVRIPLLASRGPLTDALLAEIRGEAKDRAQAMGAVILREVGEQERTFMGVQMREYVFRIEKREPADELE